MKIEGIRKDKKMFVYFMAWEKKSGGGASDYEETNVNCP